MPRRVRNPGSGKAPVNTPPSGIPAKGVGKGDGWGGPPKGAGRGGPATRKKPPPPFTAATRPTSNKPNPKNAKRKKAMADKAARIEQFNDHLADIALNAPRDETRLSALIAALNRLEGMPKQQNENINVETSFEELVRRSLKPKTEE